MDTQKPKDKERLNDAISSILDKEALDNAEKAKALNILFLKTIHPESFCPDCESQMFFTEGRYQCLNCGYDSRNHPQVIVEEAKGGNQPIPKSVENLLSADKRKSATSSDKAEKIRRLADQVRSGNVPPPNAIDDQVVKGSDPNVKEVNWV